MAAKPIAAKLFVKPDTSYWTSHPNRDGLLEPLPQGANRTRSLGSATVAVSYADDDEWSALRFRPLRDGEPQFTGGR